MTVPFDSYTFADEEDITVYVKLTVPAGKSIVVTLFRCEEAQAVQLIYLNDAQEEFRYGDYFRSYVATTRDGKDIAIELGGETSFLCEEGKIHVVLYTNGL